MKIPKIIIYTFTSLIKIKFNFEIENEKFQTIIVEEIKHILLNNIKLERQLEIIKMYFIFEKVEIYLNKIY